MKRTHESRCGLRQNWEGQTIQGKPIFLPGLSFCHPSIGDGSARQASRAEAAPSAVAVAAKGDAAKAALPVIAILATADQSQSKRIKPVWLGKLMAGIRCKTIKMNNLQEKQLRSGQTMLN
jgi:hypothetical protein